MNHVITVAVIAALNVGFSIVSRASVPTPENVCNNLQAQGIVNQCDQGAPWAFETVRHGEQYSFVPSQPETFKCYTVSDGSTHVPCTFKGTIIQFSNASDMSLGIEHIRKQNHYTHVESDLSANVIRANTTLEHYAFYVNSVHNVLAITPITENMQATIRALNKFGMTDL